MMINKKKIYLKRKRSPMNNNNFDFNDRSIMKKKKKNVPRVVVAMSAIFWKASKNAVDELMVNLKAKRREKQP